MNFEVVFLGTGAAVPVPSRGTTSQFVDIHGHTYLVDAGEGVQLALRKNKRKFQKLKGVFISHMHGDHVLGLPGLLSTMSLLGRREPLPVWGPDALGPWLDATWQAVQAHMSYEVEFKPWGDGVEVLEEGERHRLVCAPAKHRIPTRALRIEEHSLPWKLDGAKAKSAGMPFHVRQALKRGESVLWNEKASRGFSVVQATRSSQGVRVLLRHPALRVRQAVGRGGRSAVPRLHLCGTGRSKGQRHPPQHGERSGAVGQPGECETPCFGAHQHEVP